MHIKAIPIRSPKVMKVLVISKLFCFYPSSFAGPLLQGHSRRRMSFGADFHAPCPFALFKSAPAHAVSGSVFEPGKTRWAPGWRVKASLAGMHTLSRYPAPYFLALVKKPPLTTRRAGDK